MCFDDVTGHVLAQICNFEKNAISHSFIVLISKNKKIRHPGLTGWRDSNSLLWLYYIFFFINYASASHTKKKKFMLNKFRDNQTYPNNDS